MPVIDYAPFCAFGCRRPACEHGICRFCETLHRQFGHDLTVLERSRPATRFDALVAAGLAFPANTDAFTRALNEWRGRAA